MKFSIVIATYNRKDILIDAIKKIMATDFPMGEYEIIVGDNNSTDDTRQLVEDFIKNNDGKVNLKYLVEKRKGNVYARHSAVKHSTGKYLVFCDDDCFVAENWLSEIDRVFNLHPDLYLLGTRIEILWDTTPPKWIKHYQGLLGQIRGAESLIIKNFDFFVNSGSMAIPKNLFEELGGIFPEQIEGHYVGDGESGLCRKLHILQKPIGLTNDTFVYHYQIVAKNAKMSDIKRRYQNNGICSAYHEVCRLNINTQSATIKFKYLSLFKCLITVLLLKISSARSYYFNYFFFKKKAEYINVFLNNITDNNKDWELNGSYNAPDLVCSTKLQSKTI